ncbi:hypothetical protein KIW84_034898 [Lathyrus oleraceus]|uniref:Uncharacterized protein n=1 Tax=Pisum sativum TaxID=3888 RepID=A0A9D4Y541_PEA|nr:hypothetical protein KIW84_034898 [Pisum sativum]
MIECEGLHLLCLSCGRFRHYKEGCQERRVANDDDNGGDGSEDRQINGSIKFGETSARPWTLREIIHVEEKTKKTNNKIKVIVGITKELNIGGGKSTSRPPDNEQSHAIVMNPEDEGGRNMESNMGNRNATPVHDMNGRVKAEMEVESVPETPGVH